MDRFSLRTRLRALFFVGTTARQRVSLNELELEQRVSLLICNVHITEFWSFFTTGGDMHLKPQGGGPTRSPLRCLSPLIFFAGVHEGRLQLTTSPSNKLL